MPRAELYMGELLLKIIARETGEISKVDFKPQKPAFNAFSNPEETFLERRTPESQGVSSAFFTALIRELNEDPECKMHKIMFLRHGYVIAECAYAPFSMDTWHVTYSMCKSIVGMAIGILIDEEKLTLDTRLTDILKGPLNLFKKPITVRQLLNMTSGAEFNEVGAISGNDWRKSFLESALKFEPGSKFEYNSMNTYMLSAIVTELTGVSLFDFCKERIFDPMGIKRVFWESCPQSITKGGWGLFMRAEDMAKLGQLYLQKGQWNGRQIVPESWVTESTTWQVETGKDDNKHYGYQLWINDDRPGSFAYNGMLGQNVFVYPDIDMVVVTNAGNADIFQASTMAVKIRERMKNDIQVSDEPLPEDNASLDQLKKLCKSISGRSSSFPFIASGGWRDKAIRMSKGSPRNSVARVRQTRKSFEQTVYAFNSRVENQLLVRWLRKLNGNVYELEKGGVGIFPLMMQLVHNNFTDGMKKVGFRLLEDNSFYIDIYEGENIYKLRCGFGGKTYVSDINMHTENYKVALKSTCTRDEYNRLVIRNDIHFLEEACLRSLNVYFEDLNRIEIRMTETPGTDMLMETLDNFSFEGSGLESVIISKFMKGGMKEGIGHAITNTVQPVIYGHLYDPNLVSLAEVEGEESPEYDILDEEQ
jgi:CubicO group peptidase (beta-lactamase class C family)